MESIIQKLDRNIRQGTFFKNVPLALKNRVIKKITTTNLIYFFDKWRVLTKKYQQGIKKIDSSFVRVGNYYLDSRLSLDKKSVIYSLGVLTDISFDLALSENYGCKVFMYDPTPISIAFMKKYTANTRLMYQPIGVWTENTSLKFYIPKLGGSASVMSNQASNNYFRAKCLTMETLMQQNKHNKIDVFKADIEGAALPVLNQMIEKEIYPEQIIAEFERPRKNKLEINAFFNDLTKLRLKLKEVGYQEYILPRQRALYYSLELLFVKKQTAKNECI